jgi:hypothetical protein
MVTSNSPDRLRGRELTRLSPARFARSGGDGGGWEDGGMPDAVPPVDLASLAAGGNHPGVLWRLDGEDLRANLVRLGRVITSSRTATTRSHP